MIRTWYRRYVLTRLAASLAFNTEYTLDIDSSNLSTYCIDNYSALVGEFRQMYITYTNWVIHSTPLFWPHIKLCPKPSGRTAQLKGTKKAIPSAGVGSAGWKKTKKMWWVVLLNHGLEPAVCLSRPARANKLLVCSPFRLYSYVLRMYVYSVLVCLSYSGTRTIRLSCPCPPTP